MFKVAKLFFLVIADDQGMSGGAQGGSPSGAEREAPVDVTDRLAQFGVEGNDFPLNGKFFFFCKSYLYCRK